jgi:hypothetical protein
MKSHVCKNHEKGTAPATSHQHLIASCSSWLKRNVCCQFLRLMVWW